MRRRQILKYVAAAATVNALKPASAAEGAVDFSPELYAEVLDSGKPFMLGFHADWWSVCAIQERTVSALIANNPEYSSIKIIRVDWTEHRKSPVVKELRIPRRSTLVMFKGGKEIARVIAQTNKSVIEDLFKAAIS